VIGLKVVCPNCHRLIDITELMLIEGKDKKYYIVCPYCSERLCLGTFDEFGNKWEIEYVFKR